MRRGLAAAFGVLLLLGPLTQAHLFHGDVASVALSANGELFTSGDPVALTGRIRNSGSGSVEVEFHVAFYYNETGDSADASKLVAVRSVAPPMLSDEEREVQAMWDSGEVPEGNVTLIVVADSADEVGDENPANNTFTLRVRVLPRDAQGIPPVTQLRVAPEPCPGPEPFVSSRHELSLHAASPEGVPILATLYRLIGPGLGGDQVRYATPFALQGADALYLVRYYSVDERGVQEDRKTNPLRLDNTAPLVELLEPGQGLSIGGQRLPSDADREQVVALLRASAEPVQQALRFAGAGVREAAGGAAPQAAAQVEALANALADAAAPPRSVPRVAVGNVTVSGAALDPPVGGAASGVARVQVLVDGQERAVLTGEPFQWTWPAGDEALGEHEVRLVAEDCVGNAASAAVQVHTLPTSPAGLAATLRKLGVPAP